MKKETPEEAYDRIFDGKLDKVLKAGFIAGAKWQQERNHSDKEVLELLLKMNEWPTTFDGEEDIKEWLKLFKNKLYNITK